MFGAFVLTTALVGALAGQPAPTTPTCTSELEQAGAAYAEALGEAPGYEQAEAAGELLRRASNCPGIDAGDAARAERRRLYLWLRLDATGRVARLSEDYLARFGPDVSLAGFAYVVEARSKALTASGRVPEAIEGLHAALEQLPDSAYALRVDLLASLGSSYSFVSEFERSLQAQEEAIALARRALPSAEANGRIASSEAMLADALLLQYATTDRPTDSVLRRARMHALRALAYPGGSDETRAFHLLVYGEVLSYLGDTARADSALGAALRLTRSAGSTSVERSVQYKLGRHALATGRFEEAERALKAAHRNAASLPDLQIRRRIATDLGLLYERRGDPSAARAWYEEAVGLTERFREHVDASHWSAASLSGWQMPYRGLARLALADGHAEQALAILNLSQARNLRAMQQQLRTASVQASADADRLDSLTTRLEVLRTAAGAAGAYQGDRDALEADLVRTQANVARMIGRPPAVAPLDLPAVQRRLEARGAAAVVYFADRLDPLYRQQMPAWAVVVRPDGVQAFELPTSADGIASRLLRVSAVFEAPDATADLNAQAFDLSELHALYAELVAPFADAVADRQALTIVPDGPLHALPFAALPALAPSGYGYREARYLSDRFALSHDLALQMPAGTRAPAHSDRALVVGVSHFDGSGLPDLPGVSREIKAVRSSLWSADVLAGDEATPGALRRSAGAYGLIHLATHTVISAASPLYHHFLLREAGRVTPLHLYEIERLNLDAQLIALSSCASGQGRYRMGEGLMSLQYAFRSIGARGTLANLWNADDDVTADLMAHFYDALADGMPRDRALQRAQHQVRTAHPDASPYLWAAPVLSGEATALALPPSRAPWYLLASALGILALTLFFYRRRRARS